MEKEKGALKPLLYIEQPEFFLGTIHMQNYYSRKINKEKKSNYKPISEISEENNSEKNSSLVEEERKGLQNFKEMSLLLEREDIKQEEGSSVPPKNEKMSILLEKRDEKQMEEPETFRDVDSLPGKEAAELKNKEVWATIRRLSRYPNFLEKPLCEAIINGEKIKFSVHQKRGNEVRIKLGGQYKILDIDEIEEIKILWDA